MNNYYLIRINKAIDYIEENLDKKITTKELAQVSAFSEFHFHRIFKAVTNETVNQYIKRVKMGKSHRKIVTSRSPITTIAFDYGYNSSANFTRDFREYFKDSPLAVRKSYKYFDKYLNNTLINGLKLKYEGLKEVPSFEVIYIRVHTGYNPVEIQRAFGELLNLLKVNKIKFSNVTSYGIGYDDPDFTPQDKCRYDACISIKNQKIDTGNLNIKKIEPGLCSVYLFEGRSADFAIAWDFIINTWMNSNIYKPGGSPHFEEYLPQLHIKKDFFKARLYLPIVKF